MARLEESDDWNDEARIACHFSFRCPQTWDRLTPTADAAIRHCSECERDVHLALTQADFRRYSEDGQCVAVRVLSAPSRDCWMDGGAGKPFNGHLQKV
jgi:hypothetical protein